MASGFFSALGDLFDATTKRARGRRDAKAWNAHLAAEHARMDAELARLRQAEVLRAAAANRRSRQFREQVLALPGAPRAPVPANYHRRRQAEIRALPAPPRTKPRR